MNTNEYLITKNFKYFKTKKKNRIYSNPFINNKVMTKILEVIYYKLKNKFSFPSE